MKTQPIANWQSAPARPQLRPSEVHLWRADLDSVEPSAHRYLSSCELARAARLAFDKDRLRFCATRAVVRRVLASYLDVLPGTLEFATDANGKPTLVSPATTLRFNLSHSENMLLLAVTSSREVGVDVEAMSDKTPFQTLADHYFDPNDAWLMRMLPQDERAWFFYDIWTSAEARLKASGAGLKDGLNIVKPDRWSLLTMTPEEGFAAALAVEGRDFELSCWTWAK